jgi:hypothetical protein
MRRKDAFAVFAVNRKSYRRSRPRGRRPEPADGRLIVMTIDPLRLTESAAEAVLVLAAATLPTAVRVLSPALLGVLAAMAMAVTSGVYALHAVTFDCFRLTGQRAEHISVSTRSED